MCQAGDSVRLQDDRAGAPVLLAPSGERLALRHEMRRPFAVWLSRQAASAAQGRLSSFGVLPESRGAVALASGLDAIGPDDDDGGQFSVWHALQSLQTADTEHGLDMLELMVDWKSNTRFQQHTCTLQRERWLRH